MSIDQLKNKIRKLRNPSAVLVAPTPDSIPPAYRWEDAAAGMGEYCVKILEALNGILPAARISFGAFALYGAAGMEQLDRVLDAAAKLGYYVILDWNRLESAAAAKAAASMLFENRKFDALCICGYAGSAAIKPYIAAAGTKKAVFVILKTEGKSGSELQDLQTCGRVVYTAAADQLSRLGEGVMDRCGYSRVAGVVSANHSASIRTLRMKYPKLFLLVDGLELPNANAKNASLAFDKMGYGALVCCDLPGMWQDAAEEDPVEAVVSAAQRMKRNIGAYVTVL